jgi:hypothetical protein
MNNAQSAIDTVHVLVSRLASQESPDATRNRIRRRLLGRE